MEKEPKFEILTLALICLMVIIIFDSLPKRQLRAQKPYSGYITVEFEPYISPNPNRLPENPDKPVKASWYPYFLGEIEWSLDHDTAAYKYLPRYSWALVTNLDNGKSVEVFINDWGPEDWTGVAIDLSAHAFEQIASLNIGLINVKIEKL